MGFLSETLDKVGEIFDLNAGFEAGTHEVTILQAEGVKDSKDRDIIKVTVGKKDDESVTAEATLWFHTEGGAKMGVAKVLGLLVHSVGEEKKEAVRELGKKLFGQITEPVKARDAALKLLNEKLIGKEGYLLVEIKGDYATSRYGDLWHYPAESKTSKPTVDNSQAPDVDASEIPDFGEV